MNSKYVFAFLFLSSRFYSGYALNILVAKVAGSKSVDAFFSSIIEVLLQENHTVTHVSGYDTLKHPNLTKVLVDNHLESVIGGGFGTTITKLVYSMTIKIPKFCNEDLSDPRTQKVLEDKFDLVIISIYFSDCYLSVVHKQKIPFIYVTPNVMMEPHSSKFGTIDLSSISASKATTYTFPLSFIGRLFGSIFSVVIYNLSYMAWLKTESICHERQLCTPDMPPFEEIAKNVSVIFTNTVEALENPIKLKTANVVHLGGINIKPVKPLPKDILEWMEGSQDEGVIYFSLGSAVRPSDMKKEHLEIIVKVFGSLKQKILWKWDSKHIHNLSSNVLLKSWMPQQDILAHPKTRLFITHGGLFSTQEATYHGVPIIGLPVFGDQANNVAEVAAQGWGVALSWANLTEDSLKESIVKILNDKKLKSICKKRSKIMKDQPISSSDTVKYWVDYVMRHEGAHHLKSPFLEMPWYKIYNVDVWAFILFVATCLLIIWIDLSIIFLRFIYRLISKQ